MGINQYDIGNTKRADARWAVETFEKEDIEWKGEESRKSNETLRLAFVNDYPIDNIPKLSLEEYCKGENSFSYRVRRELQCLASMGNAWPDTFGIYMKKETGEICLSNTFKRLYGNDYKSAFEEIKSEIHTLLLDFKLKSFDATVGLSLNNMLMYKLLLIYYPEEMFPVCAKGSLQKYCSYFSLSHSDRDEMSIGIKAIMDWKKECSCFSSWTNAKMMWFAGWLIGSNYTIDGNLLVDLKIGDINNPLPPRNTIKDYGLIQYECGNCGFIFKKATRCPECGQLVLVDD